MRTESSRDFPELEGERIPRGDTGIRILLTLLFVLVWTVVESVLLIVVVFELGFALVTERAPGDRVRDFANRVVAYVYRIARYLTYNDEQAPFPFAEWPAEVEPPSPASPRAEGGAKPD
ncbi:MAG: DUF4389 domain-containing protein [Deltaproteobacteria bacterium]|nr:MAG: DUF4389 domain-containing protein [Deltaproteobacteria bacterium]